MAVIETLSNPDEGLTLSMHGKLYKIVVRNFLHTKADPNGFAKRIELDQPVLGLEEIASVNPTSLRS